MTGLGVAMPEWLTRHDIENGAWTVEQGPAERGKAYTVLSQRIMRVPFGGDETNRVIRAHEMMHAKVSPPVRIGTELGVSDASLQAAEEFRVNTLIKAAGFDLDALVDGSERLGGERLAEMKDFPSLVHGVAATAGGKACADMLRGVRKIDENLAKTLRELEKSIVKEWRTKARRYGEQHAASVWSDTRPYDGHDHRLTDYPSGYGTVTIPLAERLDTLIGTLEAHDDGQYGENEGDQMDPKVAREIFAGKNTSWAGDLHFGDLRLTRKVRGAMGRKRIASNTGVNPRRMNRMLTDPHRRVFDRTQRTNGGMVVVDLSGSMALSAKELEQMMEASPGCTIVGYSHTSKDLPNAWILARDGRRCENLPTETGGNGVDGPMIKWAVENATSSDPIVWVCDGIVTGIGDSQGDNLEMECATIVRRHKIHMVPNVTHGVAAMRDLAKGRTLPTRYVGPVRTAARTAGWAV